jgi:hypothetical protein
MPAYFSQDPYTYTYTYPTNNMISGNITWSPQLYQTVTTPEIYASSQPVSVATRTLTAVDQLRRSVNEVCEYAFSAVK